MPVDRTDKKYGCDYPDCAKAFWRPYDLVRHKRIHCNYNERPFVCPYVDCGFRANQQGGLKCHVISIHENVRLPCGVPGCIKTFSDPSGRTKHKKNVHGASVEGSSGHASGTQRPKACPSLVHVRVARHVEEHSRQDAEDVLKQFVTFRRQSFGSSNLATSSSNDPPSDPDTRPFAAPGASSAPSSSIYRPNDAIQPSHNELPGVLHRAICVQTDGWSFDNNQNIHQAYDANPKSAPTAWDYYTDAPVVSRPQVPTSGHPVQPSLLGLAAQGDFGLSQTGHKQSCRCWNCVIGSPLAPREQHQEDRAQREVPVPNEAPFPFSYRGSGHVPPSDHQWTRPPNDSSAYPRMLFDHFR